MNHSSKVISPVILSYPVILVEGLAQTLAYLAIREVGGDTVLLTESMAARSPPRSA